MKLYATTTSERASKGQGGNEFLDVFLQVKNEETGLNDHVAQIQLLRHTSGSVTLRCRTLVSEKDITIQLPERYTKKGEKKKGECAICDAPLGNDLRCPYNC